MFYQYLLDHPYHVSLDEVKGRGDDEEEVWRVGVIVRERQFYWHNNAANCEDRYQKHRLHIGEARECDEIENLF